MNETWQYIRRRAIEAKDLARLQWVPFTLALLVVAGFYFASMAFPPGWLSYLASLPPAVICAITALARVNDIGPERMGARWQVRRIALILVGAGSVMVMGAPFAADPIFPAWRTVVLLYGFAGAWLTTPGMPPWEYYITGAYRFLSHPPDQPRTPLARVLTRITGELSTEELLRRQAEWEALHRPDLGARRGDGSDP